MADPLAIPTELRFQSYQMQLINTVDSVSMLDRRVETADFGTPYWTLYAATKGLKRSEVDIADLFGMQAMRGGASFVAYDRFRCRPRAYTAPVLSPTFNFTITDQVTLVATNAPVSLNLNAGCLIEVYKTANVYSKSLHMVREDATGDTATIKITPPLHSSFTAENSKINVEKPSCVMQMLSFDLPKAWGARSATFTATEKFL